MTNENEDVKQLYTKEFKKKWFGEGEWVDEPDCVKFDYNGYKCLVYRLVKKEPYAVEEHYFGGHLCGYVLLKEDNKLDKQAMYDIDCHGGITFCEEGGSFEDENGKEIHMRCGYLIGFDCGHSGDYVPSMEKFMKVHREIGQISPIPIELSKCAIFNPVYRNFQFCVNECKRIVDQLISKEIQ